MEGSFNVPQKFSSPQEEVDYLRAQLAEKERTVLERQPEIDNSERAALGREAMKEYHQFTPQVILDPSFEFNEQEMAEASATFETAHDPVEEILRIAAEKGIKNALSVLDKTDNPHTIDEVHRRLIEQIATGATVSDLREGVPPWHVLHMTLFEITLPPQQGGDNTPTNFTELIAKMEQLFAGLRTIGSAKSGNHFVFEIAVSNDSEDIVFYVAVPNEFVNLFEKQTLSLFPQAVLTQQPHDYNIFADGGTTAVAEITLKKHAIYPLQPLEQFAADPLEVILNAFSKITKSEGAGLQFVIRHPGGGYFKTYEDIIKDVEKGLKPHEAIGRSTTTGAVLSELGSLFSSAKKEDDEKPIEVDSSAVEKFRQKIGRDLLEVNIRIAVSSTEEARVKQIMSEVESAFHQFDTMDSNALKFNRLSGSALKKGEKDFAFRQFAKGKTLPLNLTELAMMAHFPANGVQAAHQFKQSHAKTAPAANEMPTEGTLLGSNKHQGSEKKIFSSELDRMRHFYIIGQTGTGKSVFMQNMVMQDIRQGHGVCMIDPHGSDIQDILGAIPPEREKDVIYFDPSNLDRVVGLNMLEYDYSKPEQKTFVVNELFSIFQKLYGGNPESMGPMFEQYFRNATLLVMEDPESGNTLMDIGRVMADAAYRRKKLRKTKNPVVAQFWREIAGKAGGEAALENIVPYIVSKFDVFTANDYMRPIIGQQQSSFNFRQIMDERKILLVNLSKGRLGEINANLIGMIFVGKILMAALSRVDDPTKGFAPFFLHIDEFQNVSTPAIASILSEARKYKLGLVVAHQFIAQLDQDIKDAVFGNVGSMAAFRVGPEDGQFLEQQFSPIFDANDIMNIPNYQAYMKILANGVPTQPFSVFTEPPPESDPARAAAIIAASGERYGRPRDEIEAEIQERYRKPTPPPPTGPAPVIG